MNLHPAEDIGDGADPHFPVPNCRTISIDRSNAAALTCLPEILSEFAQEKRRSEHGRIAEVNRRLQWLGWPRMAARVAILVLLLGAGSCGSRQPLSSGSTASSNPSAPSAAGGPLITQVLDDIATYYLEPVSARRVAVAGAARLGALDQRLAVREEVGGGAVILTYDNRSLAFIRLPRKPILPAGQRRSKQLLPLADKRRRNSRRCRPKRWKRLSWTG